MAIASTSLCTPEEMVIWSCTTEKKTFSVCASKALNESVGYMQYRAGRAEKIEFAFPENKRHPKGLFKSELFARAVTLSFRNGNYTYEITDSLMGEATIWVSKNDKSIATVECKDSTHTLTETSMMDLMKSAGIGN